MYDSLCKYYSFVSLRYALGLGTLILISSATAARANCQPPPSAPPMCLSGTVITSASKVALVEEVSATLPAELSLGDTIQDWRVVEISPGYITVAQGEKTIRLDLTGASTADAPPKIKRGPMKRLHSWEARGEREPPK